ncbi:PAS domain-containing protein [Chloroflexia bacterium SDU3-3]|nr:PAS domain-containing protein [Chloroflexia bacterium SDU3-3]
MPIGAEARSLLAPAWLSPHWPRARNTMAASTPITHTGDLFAPKFEVLRSRARRLYRSASEGALGQPQLMEAMDELANVLEALQAAEQYIQQLSAAVNVTQGTQDVHYQHFQDLFQQAPASYLVTSLEGSIRQVNAAARAMFDADERLLVGRSLAYFVESGIRRPFVEEMRHTEASQAPHSWVTPMISWHGTPFQAMLTAGRICGPSGRATGLGVLIQPVPTQ